MEKTILITGSTDGIGLATAEMLVSMNHNVLVHGRNPQKLDEAKQKTCGGKWERANRRFHRRSVEHGRS